MQITASARKRGIPDADILHAWRNAMYIREITHEATGLRQILAIGPARNGALLELVAVPPWQATRIIHCMPARPTYRAYVEGDT